MDSEGDTQEDNKISTITTKGILQTETIKGIPFHVTIVVDHIMLTCVPTYNRMQQIQF